jgi:hypothetical protein
VAGQQLGEVLTRSARQLVELRATAETVREQHVPGRSGADGGQQLVLGDRDRHVVVAALDTEVAGEAAAAAEPPHVGAR